MPENEADNIFDFETINNVACYFAPTIPNNVEHANPFHSMYFDNKFKMWLRKSTDVVQPNRAAMDYELLNHRCNTPLDLGGNATREDASEGMEWHTPVALQQLHGSQPFQTSIYHKYVLGHLYIIPF
jgi:hypothetical protein